MLLLVRTARSKARGGERGVSGTYRLGITRDFLSLLRPEGELEPAEIGLDLLDGQPGLEVEYLSESPEVLAPEQVADYDALLMLANVPRLPAEAIASSRRLLHVARFGVGYDNVDVDACTEAGVLVTITPDGVRRAMSGAALTFILALSRKLLAKDRLTREGRWAERFAYNGVGLTGRTLGVVGLGNIGRDILKLATPHEMRHLAFDPYVSSEDAGELGVELVELDELLAASDFVCLACMLNDETRHLMNADRLALMKPTALPRQRCPRGGRRSGCTPRGTPRAADRRRRPRRLRARTDRPRRSDPRARQRHRHTPCDRLDRREPARHRAQRLPECYRRRRRARAPVHREP